MKVSIVTVTRNARNTLPKAIESFQHQSFEDKELMIVDGDSSDGTQDVLAEIEDGQIKWTSEPDHGIYDAMNKGIELASGDVVGILNADDQFASEEVLSKVVRGFDVSGADIVYSDIVFKKNEKIWRYYSAHRWTPKLFTWGMMPPHPGVFIRTELFEKLGLYKIDYKIAADYELLIRFFASGLKSHYLDIVSTNMSLGGISTKNLSSNLLLNQEIVRACRENGLYTNYLMVYSKYFYRWYELIKKPKY